MFADIANSQTANIEAPRDITASNNIKINESDSIATPLDDVGLEEVQPEAIEKLHEITETVTKAKPPGIPESASRVIMPVRSNATHIPNEVLKELKRPTQTQTAHPVKILDNFNDEKTDEGNNNVKYDTVTGELIGGDHPCHRECFEGEEPMICYYHFQLEWYQTMSKACYDCPMNEADCARPDCIPADGMNRPLNVINRKMPGPAIEVSRFFFQLPTQRNSLRRSSTGNKIHV